MRPANNDLSSGVWLYTTSEWILWKLRNSLDCVWHAALYVHTKNPWFKETPTQSVGTYCVHKQQHQTLVQMFWHSFQQIVKTISTKKLNHQWTINIFIHFLTTESQGLMRFPHQYPPPRPRPAPSCTSTAAFASRSRSTTESRSLRAAKCSGVLPREPRPEAKPQAEPNGTRGRKILRKFWAPQKSKFGKLWPLKTLPELKEHCAFEEVLMTSSWLKKAMWTRLAVKMLWGNFKNVPSLRKQVCVRLGHNRIWNQSRAVDISCNRVRGLARILTGKKHKFLRFVRTANNDPVKQCLITVYIRMDTPEPQKQFELWWAWHSISRLKSLSQENSDPKCRNDIVVFTNNNTKHWCKCLDTLSKQIKQYPPKSGTISEPSTSSYTSQRNPKASWGFPPQYPTPRPQPNLSSTSTAAFASRSRWTTESWPFAAAQCSGVKPREPRPEFKPLAEPNGRKWRKSLRKFWAPPKNQSFGNCGHSKILPGLKEHCAFEEVLMTSSWLKKAMWTRLAVKMLWGNFKNVPSLRKQICVRLGQNLKSVPCSRYFL